MLGGDEVVGGGCAAGEGFGDVKQVFVEELDVHVVFCGGVEFLGEVVDPGASQGVGGDSCSGEHGCGCCGCWGSRGGCVVVVESGLEEIGPVEEFCPEVFEDVEVRFDVVVEEGERVIHVIFSFRLSLFY